ncbi:hypothetical protein O0I10_002749 [Lichtheimia ornata]|uniref:Uncharacterized protein n=1 Tax=Lichtheimia ornata TaxID=688661 RepID=A0AAD7VA91_9FUNG|nr:uncharacterized protein O0I10_002749 [Lichtheimia ornata]KAJ8661483.1 hypothetical protein O0I10_002749 [Lichtheimia ornata]
MAMPNGTQPLMPTPIQPHPQQHPPILPYMQQQQQQQQQPPQQPMLSFPYPYPIQPSPSGRVPIPTPPSQPHGMFVPPPAMQQQPPMPQNMIQRLPPHIQGLYSTYPTRLKHSQENALLLPTSYLAARKSRFESEDDFDEYADDSDDGASAAAGGGSASMNNPPAVRATRSATAAAAAQAQAQAQASAINRGTPTPSSGAPPGAVAQHVDMRRIIRKRNHIYPPQHEIDRASTMEEVLVPIRLDIDLDDVKLRDVFLWNMNEQFLTPEKFAEILCEDLELSVARFVPLIAESIRNQVVDFEAIHEVELPPDSIRVVINLDLQIGKINLRDRFEWDLENTTGNAPEIFSRQLAAEVGLGGEYVCIIAHAIREQLYRHKRQWVDESLMEELAEPLATGFRSIESAETWAPQMELLSNEELEKLLIAQERNMRRLRRETRFKRSRRRVSVTPSRRNYGTP